MTAMVNQQLCIGCTLCAQSCPGVFRMQKDKSFAYNSPVPYNDYESVRMAAEQCPMQGITLSA